MHINQTAFLCCCWVVPASSDESCQICRTGRFLAGSRPSMMLCLCSLLRIPPELFLCRVSLCDRVYYTSLSTFPPLYLFYYNADISVAMVTNCSVTFFSFFTCTESGFFFCRPPLCEGALWSRLLWATSGPHGDERCGLQWGHQEALASASSVDIRCV